MAFHLPWTSAAILESVEYVLLFLLFLFSSTPYRITVNSFSVSLTEIFAWIYILWRWAAGGRQDKEAERGIRWLIRGFFMLAAWSGFLWLLSIDWNTRRIMFLDWALAALVFLCLLRSPIKDWRRIALLFVLAALPNAILGMLQHAMGIGLAPKDFSGWGNDASNFPVYGYFRHSNDLAVYLYWPFLISAALSFVHRTWSRLFFAVLTVLFGVVLYWTISRSTLLTIAILVVLVPIIFFVSRRKSFLRILAVGIGIAALALAGILLTQPIGRINEILSGRLDLWGGALRIIFQDEYLLPLGYLAIPPESLRVFWIPHNIYILFWIEFGWVGIILLAGMAGFLLWTGWTRYEKLHSHRPAAVLWSGLAGLFLINGMASLYFHETHIIVAFICVAAIWIAQIREIDSAAPGIPANGLPEGEKAHSGNPPSKRNP